MRRPGNRGGRRYVVVAVLALVAILVGAVGPLAYGAFVDTSAKDRIEADPPPALFPDATVSPIGRKIDAQATTARTLMATWWRDHGRTPGRAATRVRTGPAGSFLLRGQRVVNGGHDQN